MKLKDYMTEAKKFKTLEDEIEWLKKELDKERQLGKSTMAHAKQVEGVAKQQVINDIQTYTKNIFGSIEEYRKVEMTPQRQQMLFREIDKIKNALKRAGVRIT